MELPLTTEYRAKVEEFQRTHRIGLVTLLFTDIIGSTRLKSVLGDEQGLLLIRQHNAIVRELLEGFPEAQEISTAGDSFFMVFSKPSDAVKFSLILQARLRELSQGAKEVIEDRIGIHVGEVLIEGEKGETRDLYGVQVDSCSRIMSLGRGDQILMSKFAFDSARQVLSGRDIEGVGMLSWQNHGSYLLKGTEESVEICEVGEEAIAALKPPPDSDKAKRTVSEDAELVLGWRPAIGQQVPNTQWMLEEKLGEGAVGEVWRGRHRTLKQERVFKFCFDVDRVRSLKREVTLFRMIKDRIGEHPNIVGIHEVYFEDPPFYIVMDYSEGVDLKKWCEQQGGVSEVPLGTRLEIVAEVADALQAAHDAGVIHRDVKPGNILIQGEVDAKQVDGHGRKIRVKLTDFGIGQVISGEAMGGMTKLGFTKTLMSSHSPSLQGTHLYMAPELVAGQLATIRSDIYSMGVVLYQLLVEDFNRPLTTDWAKGFRDRILHKDLEKCFAGNPHDRFPGAGQLASLLRIWRKRKRNRLIRLWGKGAIVPAAFSLIALIFLPFIPVAPIITKLDSPSALPLMNPQTITLTEVVGVCEIIRADGNVKPASVGSIIYPDDAIRTGKKSRAELTFEDGSLFRMGSNTRFAPQRNTSLFKLIRGSGVLKTSSPLIDGQVAHLVEDEQGGRGVLAQVGLEGALDLRGVERVDDVDGDGKENAHALLAGGITEGGGEMRLA